MKKTRSVKKTKWILYVFVEKFVSDNTLIKSGVKTLVFSPNTTELYSSRIYWFVFIIDIIVFHLLIRGMCVTYEKKVMVECVMLLCFRMINIV